MKSIFKRLTLLAIPFMAVGCSVSPASSNPASISGKPAESSSAAPSSKDSSGKTSSSSSKSSSKSSSSISSSQIAEYVPLLPQIKFTFDKNDPNANFATVATKGDLVRPEVEGKFTIENCPEQYKFAQAVQGTMKVRGNQTANWSKKGFRIKFGGKTHMLGLNGDRRFKKWVLLADAKDTTLCRTALGLYMSKGVVSDGDKVWVSDFTPVTLYLNDEYWGLYYLAEQKETKTGRIDLPEPAEGYTGVDIGYCFELDHYADSAGSQGEASEVAKGAEGDPTFRVKYLPEIKQGHPSGSLATGQVYTYTMNSDITDCTEPDKHCQADYSSVGGNGAPSSSATKTSNSNQLSFIRDRVEASYQVLYEAAVNKKAKEINDNNQVISSSKTVQQVMEQHFNLNAWVDGYIINAVCIPPDLGYSSFYMSYDNTPNGDKKLRYDNPWDFDSNFGNRNGLYINGDGDEYCNNTYNTWLYLFSKLDFFKTMVKAKWNKLRNAELFEDMFHMVKTFWTTYDSEIQHNHQKWPRNDAAHQPPNNFDEIRSPFKDPKQYKQAQEETVSWLAKRVNYLEKQWGQNRPNVNTNK